MTRARPQEPSSLRLLAVWLLLANILLAPVLAARPMAIATDGGLVICTSEGRVVIGADGVPSAPQPAADDHFCALCLPLSASGAAILTASIEAWAPIAATNLSFPAPRSSAPNSAPQKAGSARAPPALA